MNAPDDASRDMWRPTASWDVLRRRADLLGTVRTFFAARGYWEVETPLLSRDVCIDRWIEPFTVQGDSPRRFLQTSPEFAMKRLLIAGAEAIFEVTRSFRRGESGSLHAPEFTILEWYRTNSTCGEQMKLVETLVRELIVSRQASSSDNTGLDPDQSEARPMQQTLPESFERLSYEAAFVRFVGVSALEADLTELQRVAHSRGVTVPASLAPDDRDGWLNLLLAELVEPGLKAMRAVFLYDYPASQSALARLKPEDPRVAERFELYLDGIELCNGYQELTDAEELAERMAVRNLARRQGGQPTWPEESLLLQAMRAGTLPECAGVALGWDRLIMWLLGRSAISEVVAFGDSHA